MGQSLVVPGRASLQSVEGEDEEGEKGEKVQLELASLSFLPSFSSLLFARVVRSE